MSRLRTRLAIAIATIALLSVASVAPVSAATIRWAWVVARMPAAASYTPAAMDQGNSLGGTNSVVRDGVGQYEVTLGSMGSGGAGGGMVHVSVLGSQLRFCSVEGWRSTGVGGADVGASIRCFDRTGARVDSKFVVAFQDTNSNEGKAAYLWADQPTEPAPYEPDSFYSYNSKGATNAVNRQDVGDYSVRLRELGSARNDFVTRGFVQVSTYGDVPIGCRALVWFPAGEDMVVTVKCRDELGDPVDSRFNLTFMQRQGLKGISGTRSAYVRASQKSDPSYQVERPYSWSSADTIPTVTRSAVGVYSVELPGMPRGGAALVKESSGPWSPRCIVGGIRTDAAPQRVGVRCFNAAGAPADAEFALAYLK